MRLLRLLSIFVLAFSGVVVSAGAASAEDSSHHGRYTCTGSNGGVIPPGTYESMLITGVCYMPAGTIRVEGNLTVAPGALLDGAATFGDPPSGPVLPATVLVGGNVSVGAGAVLALGCSPAGGCIGVAYDRIDGNLTATGALGVLIQEVSIGGNASVIGGGGGAVGGGASGGCFASPIPAPWSQDPQLSSFNTPQYTDFEDSSIGGNLSVVNVQTCYIGSFRDRVGGNVNFSRDITSDPDGMELGSNLISGNITCRSNLPAIQFGESGAAPNLVGEHASGECGFGVILPNSGSPEHIAVRMSSLRTYKGAHIVESNAVTLPLGITLSGDTLIAEINNAILTGSGLVGSITFDASQQLGSSGDVVVVTIHPNGSDSFEALDSCAVCSFGGVSGSVRVVAYGTTSAHGLAKGTFLVASGGSGNGGLSTLAGWGTFSSDDQPPGTLSLVEHLAIT